MKNQLWTTKFITPKYQYLCSFPNFSSSVEHHSSLQEINQQHFNSDDVAKGERGRHELGFSLAAASSCWCRWVGMELRRCTGAHRCSMISSLGGHERLQGEEGVRQGSLTWSSPWLLWQDAEENPGGAAVGRTLDLDRLIARQTGYGELRLVGTHYRVWSHWRRRVGVQTRVGDTSAWLRMCWLVSSSPTFLLWSVKMESLASTNCSQLMTFHPRYLLNAVELVSVLRSKKQKGRYKKSINVI